MIPVTVAINCKTEEEFEDFKTILKSLGQKRRIDLEFDDSYNCWRVHGSEFCMSKYSGSWGYSDIDYYLRKGLTIISVQKFKTLIVNITYFKYII